MTKNASASSLAPITLLRIDGNTVRDLIIHTLGAARGFIVIFRRWMVQCGKHYTISSSVFEMIETCRSCTRMKTRTVRCTSPSKCTMPSASCARCPSNTIGEERYPKRFTHYELLKDSTRKKADFKQNFSLNANEYTAFLFNKIKFA